MKTAMKGIAAGCAIAFAFSAQAAEVGSGTLTLTETSIDFSNDLIFGVNVTNVAEITCIDPVLACDQFALTVDLPEDLGVYFPTALMRIVLDDANSITGVDDFDLALYDGAGNQIASSGNLPGEPETASAVAMGGVNNYTVEIIHWLVLGGGYTLDIDLDLGIPSDDVTDAELAAWIEENTSGAGLYADSRAADACVMPGEVLLEDPSGDTGFLLTADVAGLPIDHFDLQELSVFQTGTYLDPEDPALIAFRLKVASLDVLLQPNTGYYTSFSAPGGMKYAARMDVDDQGEVSFYTYLVSPGGLEGDGPSDGRFAEAGSERPAASASHYDGNGEIVIYARPQDIGLFEPGDSLSGFNAASIMGVDGVVVSIADTPDQMPDGLGRSGAKFTWLSSEECAPEATTTTSRGLAVSSRGGATGGLLLLMFGLFGLTRRLR